MGGVRCLLFKHLPRNTYLGLQFIPQLLMGQPAFNGGDVLEKVLANPLSDAELEPVPLQRHEDRDQHFQHYHDHEEANVL